MSLCQPSLLANRRLPMASLVPLPLMVITDWRIRKHSMANPRCTCTAMHRNPSSYHCRGIFLFAPSLTMANRVRTSAGHQNAAIQSKARRVTRNCQQPQQHLWLEAHAILHWRGDHRDLRQHGPSNDAVQCLPVSIKIHLMVIRRIWIPVPLIDAHPSTGTPTSTGNHNP